MNKKHLKITFAPDYYIGEFAYKLIKDVFDIEGAFLTNESTLNDFEQEDDIPGHSLRKFSSIPKKDRSLYKHERIEEKDAKKYFVWYPPLTNQETIWIRQLRRTKILKKIEAVYNISLADYPKSLPLYVWKVARMVELRLKGN